MGYPNMVRSTPPGGGQVSTGTGLAPRNKDKGKTGRRWCRGRASVCVGGWGGALFTRDSQPHHPLCARGTLGPGRWASGALANSQPPLSGSGGASLDAQAFPCSHRPVEKQQRIPLVWGSAECHTFLPITRYVTGHLWTRREHLPHFAGEGRLELELFLITKPVTANAKQQLPAGEAGLRQRQPRS